MEYPYATFAYWLKESWNGVENGSGKTPAEIEALRRAWDHGQEAGHHEGHVDGWNLAINAERERCAEIVRTAGAYTDWHENAAACADEILAGGPA